MSTDTTCARCSAAAETKIADIKYYMHGFHQSVFTDQMALWNLRRNIAGKLDKMRTFKALSAHYEVSQSTIELAARQLERRGAWINEALRMMKEMDDEWKNIIWDLKYNPCWARAEVGPGRNRNALTMQASAAGGTPGFSQVTDDLLGADSSPVEDPAGAVGQ